MRVTLFLGLSLSSANLIVSDPSEWSDTDWIANCATVKLGKAIGVKQAQKEDECIKEAEEEKAINYLHSHNLWPISTCFLCETVNNLLLDLIGPLTASGIQDSHQLRHKPDIDLVLTWCNHKQF